MAHTSIAETRLADLRRNSAPPRGTFVNPHTLRLCREALERRGEDWAA